MRIMIDLDDAAAVRSAHEIIHNALAEPMNCGTCRQCNVSDITIDDKPWRSCRINGQVVDADHFRAKWEARHVDMTPGTNDAPLKIDWRYQNGGEG